MKNKMAIVFMIVMLIFSGCGSKSVKPLNPKYNVSHVCIQNNPKVKVTEFLPIVENVFNDWGISTEVYDGSNLPDYCMVKMKYTATKSWDVTPYLSYARVVLYKDKKTIGKAEYKLVGGSMSLDLSKWASVESKMRPVLEELLSKYTKKTMVPFSSQEKNGYFNNSNKVTNPLNNISKNNHPINDRLKMIKKLYKDGLITNEEYNKKRKEILDSY